jgi:hypothetical protein
MRDLNELATPARRPQRDRANPQLFDDDTGYFDIDPDTGALHEDSQGNLWLGPPKTPNPRRVHLAPFNVRLLRAHPAHPRQPHRLPRPPTEAGTAAATSPAAPCAPPPTEQATWPASTHACTQPSPV